MAMEGAQKCKRPDEGEITRNVRARPDIALQTSDCILPKDSFMRLSNEEREHVLSFLVPSLTSLPVLARVDSRMSVATKSRRSWESAHIQVHSATVEHPARKKKMLSFALARWNLAAGVKLPPCRDVRSLQDEMRSMVPNVEVSVMADGPYAFFVMESPDVPVGGRTALNLFEPRYCWMMRRAVSSPGPPVFGWITDIGRQQGALCEVQQHQQQGDGTFDVHFICIAKFVVVSTWNESVPNMSRAPQLQFGYVKLGAERLAPLGYNDLIYQVIEQEEEVEEECLESEEEEEGDEDNDDDGPLQIALRSITDATIGWHSALRRS